MIPFLDGGILGFTKLTGSTPPEPGQVAPVIDAAHAFPGTPISVGFSRVADRWLYQGTGQSGFAWRWWCPRREDQDGTSKNQCDHTAIRTSSRYWSISWVRSITAVEKTTPTWSSARRPSVRVSWPTTVRSDRISAGLLSAAGERTASGPTDSRSGCTLEIARSRSRSRDCDGAIA